MFNNIFNLSSFNFLFKFNKPYHLGQILLVPFLIISFLFSLVNSIFLFAMIFMYDSDSLNINTFYFKNHQFTSNMVKTEDLSHGFYRLLSVDNNVILPYGSWIRFLITSLDVLHS